MNTPDNWGDYYRSCGHCGARYHESEGGCDCRMCEGCGDVSADALNDFGLCVACVDAEGDACAGFRQSGLELNDDGYCADCAEENAATVAEETGT